MPAPTPLEIIMLQVRRLQKLVDLLRTTKSKEFNLDSWISDLWFKCGTTCCAVGTACLNPWFQKRGLVLKAQVPTYGFRTGFSAASEFFGLSRLECDYLFSPSAYPKSKLTSPKFVAGRIEKLILKRRQGCVLQQLYNYDFGNYTMVWRKLNVD